MAELTLSGLDGTNPLAFLATLGVLEATRERGDARVSWRYSGGWRPVLTSSCESIETLTALLTEDRDSCVDEPALTLTYDGKRDLKPQPRVFREHLLRLVSAASPSGRRSVDWAAAFATDVAVDNNGNTKPTALHFTAGQQQFLQMALQLCRDVTAEDLNEAVVGPWLYTRSLPVFGWDATSSRDYALRASDPSTDKKSGVPGADWLALRGLAYLPTMPRGTRVFTPGCVGGWKDGRFRWPIWTASLSAPVVRSLLTLDIEGMSMAERKARGIGAACSAGIKRHDQGGRGSFAPASEV